MWLLVLQSPVLGGFHLLLEMPQKHHAGETAVPHRRKTAQATHSLALHICLFSQLNNFPMKNKVQREKLGYQITPQHLSGQLWSS